MKMIALGLIHFYQLAVSPFSLPSCRFDPSCSRYSYQAIERFGILKGGWMAAKRLARCHPLGGGGFDPVP